MTSPLDDVCCARIPPASLVGLAELRCLECVAVIDAGAHLWLRWPAGNDDVLHQVLPLPGVELYVQREGLWYRFGSRLPAEGPPGNLIAQRLDRLVSPEPIRPEAAPPTDLRPSRWRLVRDDRPRPVTGMETSVEILGSWAENATTASLAALSAARLGSRALILGRRLPLLPDSCRLWGQRLLVPLGFAPEPALPESAWCAALRLKADELAVVHETAVEVLPADAFEPLSRAGVRLAAREGAP